uniref:(northern house mosquito) hypothetical protein n=1 Tax=Culex pipiens TaxID=7175 RepID=A0A8D8G3P5_CULPI
MMLRLCAAGVLDGVACKVLVEPRVNRVDAAAFVLTDVTAKLVDSVVFVLAAVVRVGVFRRLKWSVQVGLGVWSSTPSKNTSKVVVVIIFRKRHLLGGGMTVCCGLHIV